MTTHGNMIPHHKLIFAVLDGPDPAAWSPWGNGGPTLGSLSKQCGALIRPAVGSALARACQAELFPALDSFEKILADPNAHVIVGAMIEASRPPEDLQYYQKRQDDLVQLCLSIKAAAADKPPKYKTVGFELWIVTNAANRLGLDNWGTTVKALVRDRLKTSVALRYLRSEELFEPYVDDYLTNVVDRLLEGAP